jgi:hypothetical protein
MTVALVPGSQCGVLGIFQDIAGRRLRKASLQAVCDVSKAPDRPHGRRDRACSGRCEKRGHRRDPPRLPLSSLSSPNRLGLGLRTPRRPATAASHGTAQAAVPRIRRPPPQTRGGIPLAAAARRGAPSGEQFARYRSSGGRDPACQSLSPPAGLFPPGDTTARSSAVMT